MAVTYLASIADLIPTDLLPPLGRGKPNHAFKDRLSSLKGETVFGPHPVQSADMAHCFLAGLWLFHSFLDESHRISQEIETGTGSYWHGLMHRRESDFSNSKYWFRRVSRHAIFGDLQREAAQMAAAVPDASASFLTAQSHWDPIAFMDFCESALGTKLPSEKLCERIQRREYELLLEFCWKSAIGDPKR